jgi:putative transposase
VSSYRFIEAEKASYPVTLLCRVLGVTRSGYYAWRRRGRSARVQADQHLTERICQIYRARRSVYGAPRIHAELRETGIRCGRKRVARLMRQAGLVGCHRRRGVRTTQREPRTQPAPDRLERRFVAEAPNQVWTADITYVPTGDGFRYLAVVLDVCSRRIVGWAMAAHLQTELVLGALKTRRPAPGLIHHSDQGSQYRSVAFGQRCAAAGLIPSVGWPGDCYDNAITEAFFATLECDLIAEHNFRTGAEARTALFDYSEGFYDPHRRHSALDYCAPAEFERCAPAVWRLPHEEGLVHSNQ